MPNLKTLLAKLKPPQLSGLKFLKLPKTNKKITRGLLIFVIILLVFICYTSVIILLIKSPAQAALNAAKASFSAVQVKDLDQAESSLHQAQASLEQVQCHAMSHDSQSDEPNAFAHDGLSPWCRLLSVRIVTVVYIIRLTGGSDKPSAIWRKSHGRNPAILPLGGSVQGFLPGFTGAICRKYLGWNRGDLPRVRAV